MYVVAPAGGVFDVAPCGGDMYDVAPGGDVFDIAQKNRRYRHIAAVCVRDDLPPQPGDIGTSPLYVFATTFPNGLTNVETQVVGALSIIIWTFVIIMVVK